MRPSVSILLPVLNEAADIGACLASLRSQDYPAVAEILVADGGSTDGTREILAGLSGSLPSLVVIDNPDRVQSFGLNRLIELASGKISVRTDAHTTYAADYVSRCIAALETSGADLVGGSMLPTGTSPRERAIAAAMTSLLAVGPAAFRREGAAGDADTVYLGAFRTETLRTFGGYRHLPSGVAEDADLAYRIRRAKGRIVLDPAIRSAYRPRSSFRGLWRQFRRYGRGKAEMRYLNGRFPSWRPWAPSALLLGLVAGIVIGLSGLSWWPLAALTAVWVLALGLGARKSDHPVLTMWAIAIIHVAYGFGLIWGLLAGRRAVSHLTAMGGVGPPIHPPTQDLHRDPQEG